MISLLQTRTGHVLAQWMCTPFRVPLLVFSPAEPILAVETEDGIVQLWSTATGSKIAHFEAHAGALESIAFSPDGHLLASACFRDSSIKIWDKTQWSCISVIKDVHCQSLFFLDLEIFGIAESDSGRVVLFSALTCRRLALFEHHNNTELTLAPCRDGRTFASMSSHNFIRVQRYNHPVAAETEIQSGCPGQKAPDNPLEQSSIFADSRIIVPMSLMKDTIEHRTRSAVDLTCQTVYRHNKDSNAASIVTNYSQIGLLFGYVS